MFYIIGTIKVIFVLGFLIFIHEGGHFIVAKWCKVKVKEFSIGFGKKVWSKLGKDSTIYSIRILPLGGFVDLYGENSIKELEEGSFKNSKIWKKILIVVAGALVNIFFGILLYFILILILNRDLIYSINDTFLLLKSVCESLIDLFKGNININEMSGPIGISSYILNAVDVPNLVYLMSVISISLGITNLLPIPALDGGKLLFLIIEIIRKKPIREELEIKIQSYGFLFLICLSLYISFNDIVKIF